MASKHIVLQFNDGISDTTSQVVNEVKILQQLLKDWGVLAGTASIDGKFGNKTLEAVKLFQGKKALKQDGIVGQNTWAALLKVNPSEVQIIARSSNAGGGSGGNGYYDVSKIPSEWEQKASNLVPTLVKAFREQGITNPKVLAYACATICHESSWDPNATNTNDAASKTGYPGAGLAQITWKDNYKAVSDATGIDFVGHPKYMFEPYKSLQAKAAFYKLNKMIAYIEKGDYESAAGIYNAGKASFRSDYTRKVARDTPLWLPVFQ